jgi:aminoglycoside 3-N-acetyltransferase I
MNFLQNEFHIRRLGKSDDTLFQQQVRLFREVFGEESSGTAPAGYLEDLLGNPAFLAFAIIHDQEVWGGATAHILPLYYQAQTEVFLYDMAIHPKHQRKGLGIKLLSFLIVYCHQEGLGEVFVAADEKDTWALNFYRAAGGTEERVLHFTYPVKSLRSE